MADQYDNRLWNPPSPYVTHAEMAPVHTEIGSLKKGQEHILNTYAHLRGEMLQGFDNIEKLLKRDQETHTREERGNVNLTMRELVIIAVALVIAGAFLGRVGLDRLLGG